MGMEIVDEDLSMTQVSVISTTTISRAISRACSLQEAPVVVTQLWLSEFTRRYKKILGKFYFSITFTAFAPTWKLKIKVALKL